MYGFQTPIMKWLVISTLDTNNGKLTHNITSRNFMMEEETGSCSNLSTSELMNIAGLVFWKNGRSNQKTMSPPDYYRDCHGWRCI